MAEIVKIDPRSPDLPCLRRAAELLRQGEVIAIPTDTFYGLAANPFDLTAVEKVFSLKGRVKASPLLLLVDSVEMAAELSQDLPPLFFPLAERFWPGLLTIIVEASPKIPPPVTAHTGRIGLRLPAAAIPVMLVREAGFPVTGTSANLSGGPACSTAEEVQRCLGERLPLILDGGTSRLTKPSTVLSLRADSWEMLREGAVPPAEIAEALKNWP
ncbi:MAG: threonylcarbamoyl-AMP synthase [Acidobacteria bacterium RIFCSPLOWO2_12_FULL_59_11]|nr:MAG: threonylcarbamoyl-AMP synthase [Acidobacteria bacterium RIFCSPLOWO2_12_FULL_59_11]